MDDFEIPAIQDGLKPSESSFEKSVQTGMTVEGLKTEGAQNDIKAQDCVGPHGFPTLLNINTSTNKQ